MRIREDRGDTGENCHNFLISAPPSLIREYDEIVGKGKRSFALRDHMRETIRQHKENQEDE